MTGEEQGTALAGLNRQINVALDRNSGLLLGLSLRYRIDLMIVDTVGFGHGACHTPPAHGTPVSIDPGVICVRGYCSS